MSAPTVATNLSSSTKPELRLDWCSAKASKYAVMNWHYSKKMPRGKLVKIGIWEDGNFIGAVIFARGANHLADKAYGCSATGFCELVRIAMREHKVSVSKCIALALKFLQRQSAGVELVISYADPAQGHHGGVYQASNWIYVGKGDKTREYFKDGKWVHRREASYSPFGSGGAKSVKGLPCRVVDGKHKYLYPLTPEMRAKIEPLRKPYPKRASDKGNHPDQGQGGGAVPT